MTTVIQSFVRMTVTVILGKVLACDLIQLSYNMPPQRPKLTDAELEVESYFWKSYKNTMKRININET